MFCLIYNIEYSKKPSIWVTIGVFIVSTIAICCEQALAEFTNSVTDLIHLASILILITSVAVYRKELTTLLRGVKYFKMVKRADVGNDSKLPSVNSGNCSSFIRMDLHRLQSTRHHSRYFDISPYTNWRAEYEKDTTYKPGKLPTRSSSAPGAIDGKLNKDGEDNESDNMNKTRPNSATALPTTKASSDAKNSTFITFY